MPITTDVSSVRAVLFDVDDTLVDTKGAFRHALAEVGRRHLPGTPDADAMAAMWRADVGGWYRAFTRGEMDYREQRMRRANELHAAFGGDAMDEADYDAWDLGFEAAFREGWAPHADAAACLDALDAAGVRYGAVSNAAVDYQPLKLAACGLARVVPYLHKAGLVAGPDARDLTPHEEATLALAAPLVQTRVTLLGEVPGMLGFLFVGDSEVVIEDDARAKLPENTREIVDAAISVLSGLDEFTAASLQEALTAELVDRMEIKPRFAFGPLRVAVTGRLVSPPLFESMEILGKEHALARLHALRATV